MHGRVKEKSVRRPMCRCYLCCKVVEGMDCMTSYYRIGEFSALSGVSVKTLRFYDERGLLRPAAVDGRTRYRLYSAAQLEMLASILALKDLGVSLAEIRVVTDGSSSLGERRKLLESFRARLERSICSANRSLRWIDMELREMEQSSRTFAVAVKQRTRLRVASVRSFLKNYEGIGSLERQLFASVPADSVGKTRGVLWHHCAESGWLEAEPFVELKREIPRRGHYDVHDLSPVTVACAYSSFEEDAEPAYDAIRKWMGIRGFQLAGAKREIYLGSVLEIQFPFVSI